MLSSYMPGDTRPQDAYIEKEADGMADANGHEYVQRTFRLQADTVRKLDEYSKRTGVTRTFAVEKAILEYLAGSGGSPGAAAKKGGAGA